MDDDGVSLFSAVEDLLKCVYQNGGCEHFCDGSGDVHRCFCADGYELGADGRSCTPQGNDTPKTRHHQQTESNAMVTKCFLFQRRSPVDVQRRRNQT